MAIGEAPARREVENQARELRSSRGTAFGRPLVGDSGREYDELYLPLAGLTRSTVYTTNVVKCANPDYSNPADSQARACAQYHLNEELRLVQPRLIVCLGAIAAHVFIPDLDMELSHGIPIPCTWGDWKGELIAMYHPAAGMRAGRMMNAMLADWKALGEMLDRCGWFDEEPSLEDPPERLYTCNPVDAYPTPDYAECTTAHDVACYLDNTEPTHGCIAQDTEVETLDDMTPFCMSLSVAPGTSRVIRAVSTNALAALNTRVQSGQWWMLYHNGVFDPPVLESMGVHVFNVPFRDTMQMAYHLGNIPQGLKALAWRLCGMPMKEFEDVATGPSAMAVGWWLMDLVGMEECPPAVPWVVSPGSNLLGKGWVVTMPDNPYHIAVSGKDNYVENALTKAQARRLWEAELLSENTLNLWDYRGKAIAAPPDQQYYLKTFLRVVNGLRTGNESALRLAQKCLTTCMANLDTADPWKRWDGWSADVQARLLTLSKGVPMPAKSIVHVPWPDALHYSARDADATIRIYPVLDRMHSALVGVQS
jgi:uracil-DNA glycosylase family 4